MHTDHDYLDYWEKCWNEENVDDISGWQDSWNSNTGSEEMELFSISGVRTICDAACGFGAHTLAFSSNGFIVSAFDVSPRAVELTRSGLSKFGYDVDVKTADITATGYDDDSFDAVTAYAVLDHLSEIDAKRALSELLRITKPGGLLLLSFDTAEEDDFLCPHELLPDGSMIYADDTDRAGMIFRSFDDDMILSFTEGNEIVRQWTTRRGSQMITIKKADPES